MDKFAQRRGILNKLHEALSPSGNAAEKFFNPEFQKVMVHLRQKDDTIRAIVAGETIGDGEPGKDPIGLKQLVKQAKSNLNRREYMSAVSDLGRFHAKLFEIINEISSIDESVNAVHHEFLFKDLDDERKKHLHDLKTRLAARQAEMVKQAGVMDFFHNIGTQRGRALAAWEKRYPKQTKKLKVDTDNLIKVSEGVLSFMLSALKDMATARAARNVDNYMASAKKIEGKYATYDIGFRKYYAENVKGFLEKINLIDPPKEETKPGEAKEPSLNAPGVPSLADPKTLKQGPSDHPASSALPFDLINRKDTIPGGPPSHISERPSSLPFAPTIPSGPLGAQTTPPTMSPTAPPSASPTSPPSMSPTIISPPPSNMGSGPASSGVQMTRMSPEEMRALEEQHGVTAHKRFYEALESMSNESPALLGSFISKYAKKISGSDPVTSIQLLKIAKQIKG